MERMILSLKNLYMLLMNDDFPIYSESVIGRAERKGQTMLRFWQGMMIEEFRSLPCGSMFWRNDGKRNRYTSYLCNRSAEIKTYSDYAKEIAALVSQATMLSQIRRFADFLSVRKYRHAILVRRILEFVRLVEVEDLHFSSQIAEQIRGNILLEEWEQYGEDGKVFQASYLMTVLMLYAAAGAAMDDSALNVFLEKEYSMEHLWTIYTRPVYNNETLPVFLTVHSGILQDNPLPAHRFFGREEELFNLKEAVRAKEKYLISGIGGIGKTELLRQLICVCKEEKLVDRIAIVPYMGSIVESFARCFAEFQRREPEESFRYVLNMLNYEARQRRLLLLIDNLTNSIDEDPNLERLTELNCAVFIASRRSSLKGYETYSLNRITMNTGALIFRDNYCLILGKDGQSALQHMLKEELICHPLTLKLMARAAKGRNWSVEELQKEFENKQLDFSWQEEGRTERAGQIYRQLYSYVQMSEEGKKVAELFTLLPSEEYTPEFIKQYFPTVANDNLTEMLEMLAEAGWLEKGEGYSMHPLIAQCLRRRVVTESHLRIITEGIQSEFDQIATMDPAQYEDEAFQDISSILVYAVSFLSGSVSEKLMILVLKAMRGLFVNRQNVERYQKLIEYLMKHCRERTDAIDILYGMVLGNWHCREGEYYMSLYHKYRDSVAISKESFLDFLISAGECLCYKKEYKNAGILLKEALCDTASPIQRANTYYNLCVCCEMQGDAEAYLYWATEGAEYVKANTQCGDYLRFHVLAAACGAYIKFGRGNEAGALLPFIKELAEKRKLPTVIAEYENTAGAYELYFGKPEMALEHYRRAAAQSEAFWNNDPNYIQTLGQTAIVLQRLKRYEEALETYEQALACAKQNDYEQLIHLFSNNTAVLHLEMERPKEAIEQLEVALELARQQGGIALGEVQRNRAGAFRQLGDVEKEYQCLQEAVPLLEEAYGIEHPRAQVSRKRLEELRGEI